MSEATARKTVLVVDDSRFFRSMLSYALTEDGLRPLVAGSGEEAIDVLQRELPDVHLVLLDLVMPGMNGFEVVGKIRALEGAGDLPVIVVSQYALNHLEKEILRRQGVVASLTKAAPMERILFEVREAVFPEESERRRTTRMPVSLAVCLKTTIGIRITSTFNVSDTGMFLVFSEEDVPPPGADVALKFWIPDGEAIFEVKARVAWVNAPGPNFRRSHPAGFGVEFVSPPSEAREAIGRFLRASA